MKLNNNFAPQTKIVNIIRLKYIKRILALSFTTQKHTRIAAPIPQFAKAWISK